MRIFIKPVNCIIVLLSGIFLLSCTNNPVPRPRGYFRIDLPTHEYRLLDSIYPYQFEYPVYARVTHDNNASNEPYWINIDFPQYNGRLHLSYKKVDNNLSTFSEDAHSLVMKHIPKASSISEIRIDNEKDRVHGIVYDIQGFGAASPYQFFVTDSTNHFLRGALYFSALPNNDSLSPVIDFIKEDLQHLLETMKWKQEN